LYSYPQTHVEWRKIAPALANDRTLVIPDLRDSGDSGKPPAGDDHVNCPSVPRLWTKSKSCKNSAYDRSYWSVRIVEHAWPIDWPSTIRIGWKLAIEVILKALS
ncbi:MAG TPA: hypothetical protein VIY48_03285, partial [Candidatus Paceibacterota bacterium]